MVIWEFTLFILKMYCCNIYFNIYTVLLLLCCCIRRAYVYLDVKSSSQMTNRNDPWILLTRISFCALQQLPLCRINVTSSNFSTFSLYFT